MASCELLATKIEVAELESEVADLEAKIAALEALIDTKIPKTQEAKIINDGAVQGAFIATGKLDPKIAANASKIGTNAGKIASLTTKVLGIASAIASIFSLLYSLLYLTPKINSIEAEIEKLKAADDDLYTKHYSQQMQIKHNEQVAEQAQKEAKEAKKEAKDAKNTADHAFDKAVKAEGMAGEALGKASIALEKAQKAEELAQIAINEISALKPRIAKIEVEVPKLKTYIQELETRIKELEFEVTILRGEIISLKSKIEVLEAQILSFKFEVFLNKEKIEKNKNQIEAVKIEVAKVKNIATSAGGGGVPIPEYEATKTKVLDLEKEVGAIKTGTYTKPEINDLIDTKLADIPLDTVNEEQFNILDSKVTNLAPTIATAVATVLSPEFNQLKNQTSQSSLSNAAAQGVCSTTQPGGCSYNMVGGFTNNLKNSFNSGLGVLNAGISGVNGVLNSKILTKLDTLSNFLGKAWQSTHIDKVLNAMNLAVSLHNAAMLSRNLAATLGETLSNVLAVVGVKDSNGSPLDINGTVGKTVNNIIIGIVGAETYANISTTWTKANRILTAATGVMSAIVSTRNAILEAIEIVGEYTAKIGNNMQIQGLFEERTFPWMHERPPMRQHLGGTMAKINDVTEVIEQINNLANTGLEAQEGFKETIEATTEFNEALQAFDVEKEAEETGEVTASASPDIDNTDLIQADPEEEIAS